MQLKNRDLADLLSFFPPEDFYLSEAAAREAIRQRGMFNVLELDSGDKIDFWLLTESAFDQSRFSRRRLERLFGIEVPVCSPEDSILAKLDWSKQSGGSQKQWTDALSILELQFEQLDFAYLDHWAQELGIADLWRDLRKEAKPA